MRFTPSVFSFRWEGPSQSSGSSLSQVVIPPVTSGVGMTVAYFSEAERQTAFSEVAPVVCRINSPLPQPQKAAAELPGLFSARK